MTLEVRLMALKEKIRQNFPRLNISDSEQKIQAIKIMQEFLAEVLLQIERVLENKPLPEDFEHRSEEQKKILTNLAQFFLALSLGGKSRISASLFYPDLIDQESYHTLDTLFVNIYAAIAYLAPDIKLSLDMYEAGASENFLCHDLKRNVLRSFTPGLITRIAGDEAYLDEIHKIIRNLDKNYYPEPVPSPIPLHDSTASSSSSSSSSFGNTQFSSDTKSMFTGLFPKKTAPRESNKKPPVEIEPISSSPQISAIPSSSSRSSKRTLSVVLTRGMFSHVHPKKLFLVRLEEPEIEYKTGSPTCGRG